ncbi:MAG: hypothetical protein GY757_44375, partial [bacterium]|nr:hypothetical protein [bacterium]
MVLKKLFYFEMLVLVLLFTAAQNLKCETVENKGFKHIKNYSYKEYDHSPQNWGMVQADNGLLYIANQGGVLEFDGVSWRIIKVPTYETARSLAIDETGTIFVGGENKIGYLSPDKYGTLQYVSLLDHFDEKYRNFFDVWATHATKNGIYFRTSKFLFRWEPKTKLVKVWNAGVSKLNIISSFVYKGNLFIQKGREGLFQVMNDSFKLLPGTKACAVAKIYMMAPYENEDSKTILIGTRKKGFFLYDGQKAKPFPTEVDVFLKAKKFLSGLRLPSGDYALATLLGGLVFMDSLGRQKDIINMTYGLQDEMIYSLFMDAGENLWLCLNSGISKIEYLSPASFYDKRSNLHGNVLSVVRHRDIIYAGTSKGLFQLDTSSEFHPVTGISSICWSLVSSGDSLLVAASDGVSFVKNNVGQRFTSTPSYVLLPSTHQSGRTWCGTSKGLMALTIKEGSWGQELLFKRITQEIRYIAEGREGNVWLLTRNGGVLKAEFPNGTRQPVVTSYNASHKLPEKLYYIGQAAGDVLFASEQGVFRFDEKRKSFILHQVLGLGAETLGGSKSVFRFAEDKNKQFWFHARGRNFQVVPAHGEPPAIHYAPFRRDAPIPVNAIYPDPDGKKLWFADLEGLIRYDSTVENNYRQDFQAIVRKVLVNEKLIFGGSKSSTTGNHEDCYQMRDYKERNLYFEYGAPFFEEENKTLFRSFMAGHDKGWSAWSSGTGRNYTNLAHGLYTFRVQAKNVYAHHGAI